MNKSRFILVLVFMSVPLTIPVSTVSGGQEKVDVCHITGTYDFGDGELSIGHVINIADPAYQSHLDHGDPQNWWFAIQPGGEVVCTAAKVVFVTTEAYFGDELGGLVGADDICMQYAIDAQLPGEYKAWLSSRDADAVDRLNHYDLPYVLPDGTLIALDWDSLVPGDPKNPIDLDAYGNPVTTPTYVWTGTSPLGRLVPGFDCGNWGLEYVDPMPGGLGQNNGLYYSAWTIILADSSCRYQKHPLYCFEN